MVFVIGWARIQSVPEMDPREIEELCATNVYPIDLKDDVYDEPESSVVFGVAVFNVPVHAVVSQGFESLTLPATRIPSIPNTTPQPPTALASSIFLVHQAAYYRPGQDGYIFQTDPPSAIDEGQTITVPDSSL